MNGKLTDVKCTYTGGGIYVVTAKYEDVFLATDLETYGTYDVPWEDIEEKYSCDYDSHWKNPSVPLPTWGELYHAITRSHREGKSPNMDQNEVGNILLRNHPRLGLRIDEDDNAPYTHSERLELLCDFIEIFEDFLDERGIVIPNPDKDQDPDASNIYGCDYGELESRIEELLIRRGMLEKEEQ